MVAELLLKMEEKSALHSVQTFVTHTLEHPLLNEETRERRKIFPNKVTAFLSTGGIDTSKCAIVPWGDFVWNSTSESDYDMVILTTDSITSNQIWNIQFTSPEMDIKGVSAIDRIKSINDGWPYVPLFIPDEYITGNLDLVHRARMMLTAGDPETRRKYEKMAPLIFNNFFRNWQSMDWYRYSDPQTQDKRAIHFNRLLNERASQTHNPEGWKTAFLDNLATFKIPDFETYRDAMTESSGALQLLSSYKNQGILPSTTSSQYVSPISV
ncbi:MAG: hypothetical protein NTZ55_03720 [Candidatus Roizmanbacteria bacterium]|nr:hypothetical protein [Candidatus Roizmanbacteria bacterium]